MILDPFGGGSILTLDGCMKYLAQHGLPFRGEYFVEASGKDMLLRHVRNLIHSCRGRDRRAEAADLQLVLRTLLGSRPARGE